MLLENSATVSHCCEYLTTDRAMKFTEFVSIYGDEEVLEIAVMAAQHCEWN